MDPNAEDDNGEYWDPWEALGVNYGGYNSAVDLDGIRVLEGIASGQYCTDIAGATGLTPEHVELWQYLFCSARWCDYGTSPRGCFQNYSDKTTLAERVAGWRAYYERHWGEPCPNLATPARQTDDEVM